MESNVSQVNIWHAFVLNVSLSTIVYHFQLKMKPSICSICQTNCFFYEKNLKNVKTKNSKRPVTDFIQLIIQKTTPTRSIELKWQSGSTCACYECLDKIDVYDLAKSTLDKIENEFGKYFSQGNIVTKTRQSKRNAGISSNSRYDEAEQLVEIDQFGNESQPESQEISEKDESMNSFDFDQDDESSDEESNIDINMYITDIKVIFLFIFLSICF